MLSLSMRVEYSILTAAIAGVVSTLTHPRRAWFEMADMMGKVQTPAGAKKSKHLSKCVNQSILDHCILVTIDDEHPPHQHSQYGTEQAEES